MNPRLSYDIFSDCWTVKLGFIMATCHAPLIVMDYPFLCCPSSSYRSCDNEAGIYMVSVKIARWKWTPCSFPPPPIFCHLRLSFRCFVHDILFSKALWFLCALSEFLKLLFMSSNTDFCQRRISRHHLRRRQFRRTSINIWNSSCCHC